MSARIAITPTSFGKCGDEPIQLLKDQPFDLSFNELKRKMASQEVIDLAKDAVGIIAGVETYDRQTLESFSSLKCISRVGVGVDSIDLQAAQDLGIVVKNTPQGPTLAVAELTVGLILDVLRKISFQDRSLRSDQWSKQMGQLLHGKIVGIWGCGRIGQSVAKLLAPFGVELVLHDKKWNSDHPDERSEEGSQKEILRSFGPQNDVRFVDQNELLLESDVLCVHVSVEQEGYLIGQQELQAMKQGSVLINVARGGIVDEQALYEVLTSGHLYGAALDVFEQEPYEGPLKELDNVVLTPHIGSYAKQARLKMEQDAVVNLIEELNK